MSKRPTDHLIPSAKKRSGDRQISREEPPSDSDEEVIAGEFRRADEGVLKQRRIFKARRGAAPAVPPTASAAADAQPGAAVSADAGAAAATASNPFAGISLTAPAAGGNPFAGVSLIPPATTPEAAKEDPAKEGAGANSKAAEAAPAAAAESAEAAAQPNSVAEAKEGNEKTAEKKADGTAATTSGQAEDEEAAAAPAKKEGEVEPAGKQGSSSAFATFASASGTGFGGLASGGAAAGNGFGGFGAAGATGFGSLGNGSTFGTLGSTGVAPMVSAAEAITPPASTSFSFNTGASSGSSFTFSTTPAAASSFPSVQNIFGANHLPATSVFGGAQETRPAVLPLTADEPQRVTGEEEERCVFSGDGVLFEYIEAQWRERGRGELRVNVAGGGQARLVMRQRGNLRLLLNANLFPGMKLTPMDGGKGTTFACINAASAEAGSAKKEEEGKDGEAAPSGHLGTFAFRVKVPGKLEEFVSTVQAHIPAAESEAPGNENNV
ncbi:hypothetical protein WJX75_000372 [Coccomyxa subellipsoidea]|uniref:RanBD1 domain-containing protein n=1 Tax=Coccomyxa subellipsoidea TaxID=248742 RepID=A0ABR2YCR3_9CHLO